MYKILIFFVIIFFAKNAFAQPFSAFVDLQQKFYLFDNGTKQNLEPLAPLNYKVGKNAIAYLNNLSIFKVYKDGVLSKVSDYFTNDYGVTDNLIYFLSNKTLSIIDQDNEVKELSRLIGDYMVGDSIAMYYDHQKNVFNAYYNFEIHELENYLATQSVKDFKASDNIGAFVNYTGNFKVFWNGNAEIIESQPVLEYEVGRNTVAYVDYNQQFKIYWNGIVYTIDGFKPKSYMVGDNVVAYVTYDGYFKIFYNGEEKSVSYFDNKYLVRDNIVAFEDASGFLQVFHKGNFMKVDNYYPDNFLAAYNSFAYIDKTNTLRFYDGSKFNSVTTMVNNLDDVRLDYDVLTYKIGLNMYRFFIDGKDWN